MGEVGPAKFDEQPAVSHNGFQVPAGFQVSNCLTVEGGNVCPHESVLWRLSHRLADH